MSTARPIRISDQRLQRLCLWLALTAAWFAAHVLGGIAPKEAAKVLAQYARHARAVLALRAVRQIAFKASRRGSPPTEIRRLTARAVGGAAFRRALRGRTLAARARALCALLAKAERWIAHIARRLKRGFTKLRRAPKPRRMRLRPISYASLPALHAVDTT